MFSILLVGARRSLARLSNGYSCGHLLNVSVFHIARLSQALLWSFIEYLCIPYCSFWAGVLWWPFIEYLRIPYCSFEPGVVVVIH